MPADTPVPSPADGTMRDDWHRSVIGKTERGASFSEAMEEVVGPPPREEPPVQPSEAARGETLCECEHPKSRHERFGGGDVCRDCWCGAWRPAASSAPSEAGMPEWVQDTVKCARETTKQQDRVGFVGTGSQTVVWLADRLDEKDAEIARLRARVALWEPPVSIAGGQTTGVCSPETGQRHGE